MQIDPTTSSSSTPAASGTGLEGNRDEFLRLFLAQLQHQDPLDPQSGSDLVAQLAQFSQVEQAAATNDQLQALGASLASASTAGMAALVGRTCAATAASFELDGTGAPPALELSSSGSLAGHQVVIRDASGAELRRLDVGSGASPLELAWDGRDAGGRLVPAGTYQIAVEGASASRVEARWVGRCDALELTAAGTKLRFGSMLVSPADVFQIGPLAEA
ncbi:MAG: flagellar hook capping FlgD N-terminal domain-containing protein [Kofleriaceae bacterium]